MLRARRSLAFLLPLWACTATSAPEGWSTDPEPAFYRYEGEDGRPVFVSDPAFAPPGARLEPFDVSHVSVNEELGADLDEALEAEHERLTRTPYCAEQRARAERGFVEALIEDRPHWVAILAVVALLLVTAPAMSRRVGAPRWLRFLAVAVPLLLLLGGLTHVLVEVQRSLTEARQVGQLCDHDGLAGATPPQKAGLVHELRRRVVQTYETRARRVDEAVESAR